MIESKAEEYRADLQKIYKECHKADIVFDDVVCMQDGKAQFIVGRYGKNERVAATQGEYSQTDAYDKSLGGVFVTRLENGELTGEPLTIQAESRSAYTQTCFSYDMDTYNRGGVTDLKICVGKTPFEYGEDYHRYGWSSEQRRYLEIRENNDFVCFHRIEQGFRDVSSPVVWADMLERSMREKFHEAYADDSRRKNLKSVKEAIKRLEITFSRFAGPIAPTEDIMKEEKERQKRIKRYCELRALVEKKRKKLAEAQQRENEKKRKEAAKVQAMKRKKEMDTFLGK